MCYSIQQNIFNSILICMKEDSPTLIWMWSSILSINKKGKKEQTYIQISYLLV